MLSAKLTRSGIASATLDTTPGGESKVHDPKWNLTLELYFHTPPATGWGTGGNGTGAAQLVHRTEFTVTDGGRDHVSEEIEASCRRMGIEHFDVHTYDAPKAEIGETAA